MADVKETLGLSSGDTSKDNIITRKINQATEMIEGWCGFDRDHHFKQATYTNEEYKGTGSDELVLKAFPVTAVSDFGVRSSVENISDWDSISNQDYFTQTNSGVLRLLFGSTNYSNNYRVTYTAGYSTIPSDLAEACATLAAYLVDNPQSGNNIASKTEGRRSVTYFQPKQTDSLITQLGLDDILSRYVIPSLAGW